MHTNLKTPFSVNEHLSWYSLVREVYSIIEGKKKEDNNHKK